MSLHGKYKPWMRLAILIFSSLDVEILALCIQQNNVSKEREIWVSNYWSTRNTAVTWHISRNMMTQHSIVKHYNLIIILLLYYVVKQHTKYCVV